MTNYSPHTCPLWLFRSGKDTYEIAAILRLTQAEVERRIHILRSHEKRKHARFDRHSEQAA